MHLWDSQTFFLKKEGLGLWLVDVQEKLLPHITDSETLVKKMSFMLEVGALLGLPLIVTEQSPHALGKTIDSLRQHVPHSQRFHSKDAFSGYHEEKIREAIGQLNCHTWVLMGVESHICVLQTAKDLLLDNKKVVVLADAAGARHLSDHKSALHEMRQLSIRVTSCETLAYELIRTAGNHAFKSFVTLVKRYA